MSKKTQSITCGLVGLTNVESHNKKAQSDDSDHSSIDPSLLDDKLLVQLELNQGDLNLPEADIFPVEFAATDWPEQELMSSTGLDETACNEQAFSEKSAQTLLGGDSVSYA